MHVKKGTDVLLSGCPNIWEKSTLQTDPEIHNPSKTVTVWRFELLSSLVLTIKTWNMYSAKRSEWKQPREIILSHSSPTMTWLFRLTMHTQFHTHSYANNKKWRDIYQYVLYYVILYLLVDVSQGPYVPIHIHAKLTASGFNPFKQQRYKQ